jgi:hypothetical protein
MKKKSSKKVKKTTKSKFPKPTNWDIKKLDTVAKTVPVVLNPPEFSETNEVFKYCQDKIKQSVELNKKDQQTGTPVTSELISLLNTDPYKDKARTDGHGTDVNAPFNMESEKIEEFVTKLKEEFIRDNFNISDFQLAVINRENNVVFTSLSFEKVLTKLFALRTEEKIAKKEKKLEKAIEYINQQSKDLDAV